MSSCCQGADLGALPLSLSFAPFVPFMIRGNGDRGEDDGGLGMKVLLTLYGDETTWETEPEAIGRAMAAWQAFDEAAREAGVLIACDGLEPGHTATTIRVAGGQRQVTDGPFMETKEQLGGYVLMEVRDLDEAIEWADRLPWNTDGCSTEIRPIMDYGAYAERAGSGAGEHAAS